MHSHKVIEPIPIEEKLTWEPLVLTQERVNELWLKMKDFPAAFDDFSSGDFDAFFRQLTSPRNVFLDIGDGRGLACGTNVRPRMDAALHLIMFDRRLRGREELFLEIIRAMFGQFRLRRMTAILANTARTGIKLVERLGFKHEGVMREAMLIDGKYVDVHVYGILREEVQ